MKQLKQYAAAWKFAGMIAAIAVITAVVFVLVQPTELLAIQ